MDNIELRSEKVRNMIGEIPPTIIRVGITVIFIIILSSLTGSWLFKYNYIIRTTATIKCQSEHTTINLKIPANEIDKIKSGQRVLLEFNNIPHLYNEKMVIKIQAKPDVLEISKNGGYYNALILISGEAKFESGKKL